MRAATSSASRQSGVRPGAARVARRCRCSASHDFSRGAAAAFPLPSPAPAWGPAFRSPMMDVRMGAGADAHAFEALLGAQAGQGRDQDAPMQPPTAGANTAAAAPAAASAAAQQPAALDAEAEGDALLPPVLPLHRGAERFAWAAPDGALLEVIYRAGVAQEDEAAAPRQRPPLVFIHGLFRGAWCWDEALMPALSSAGYDCYALSLRGQGASRLGSGIARVARARGGVPLAVNVADIAAFVGSLDSPLPPVLVGHSLGGTFVQEYLALLEVQQHSGSASAPASAAAPTAAGDAQAAEQLQMPPLPPLAGAVALASACAGTVMAFGDFVKDVGLSEFLYQMYIVFSGAHLRDGGVARYCWWSDRLPADDADTYHAACRASSRALPYIASEVAGWAPPPRRALDDPSLSGSIGTAAAAADGASSSSPVPPPAGLPPVLAVGGEEDRIIRPFQVEAFADHWDARVSVLPGVTHDAMLGGQALRVAVELLAWLEALPAPDVTAWETSPGRSRGGPGSRAGSAASSIDGGDATADAPAAAAVAAAAAAKLREGAVQQGREPTVRVLPLHQGLQEPGVGSRPVQGGSGGSGGAIGSPLGRAAPEQRVVTF